MSKERHTIQDILEHLTLKTSLGEFAELDPKGNGNLRPDDVPTALVTACEILYARMNTSR